MKFRNEPVIVSDETGELVPYVPIRIVTNRDAYAASLDIIFKQIADFHIALVEIIADKYNLNAEEIMLEVKNDERYKNAITCPNSMGYLDENEDLLGPSPPIEPTSMQMVVDEPVAPPAAAEPPTKTVRRVIKKVSIQKPIPEATAETVDVLTNKVQNMGIATEPPIKKTRVYKRKTEAAPTA